VWSHALALCVVYVCSYLAECNSHLKNGYVSLGACCVVSSAKSLVSFTSECFVFARCPLSESGKVNMWYTTH